MGQQSLGTLVGVLACLTLVFIATGARADAVTDCEESKNGDVVIGACSEVIARGELPVGTRALAYRNRADAYAQRAANDQAIADYTEAIKLNDKDAAAYAGRGQVKLAKRDYKGAIADLNEAIRLEPKATQLYVTRGYAQLVNGDPDAAVVDFSAAIGFDPKNASAYNNRGLAYRKKGDAKRAIEDYTAAIKLNPAYALAYNNRGYAYEAEGDKQAAAADFRMALTFDPSLIGAKKGLKRMGADSIIAEHSDALIAEGKALAEKNCAWCHAIGKTGNSPNARAPRWRDMQKRHPIQALRDPLTRGIARPHDEMPNFQLSDHQVDVIIAYINSLSP